MMLGTSGSHRDNGMVQFEGVVSDALRRYADVLTECVPSSVYIAMTRPSSGDWKVGTVNGYWKVHCLSTGIV